ncbi:hypothetical protein QF034_001135 [Streptomyces africanus]|uniref:Uncharacterized protein n=1 Tax=Streptomyces africanus TaxID=231024 RepID=A0ABU0QHP9_9ACTN|nr:hypothetical protein [Streptomyces africanus]MDQ0746904.1 hypothetical protein [Streptomyces africanus]
MAEIELQRIDATLQRIADQLEKLTEAVTETPTPASTRPRPRVETRNAIPIPTPRASVAAKPRTGRTNLNENTD